MLRIGRQGTSVQVKAVLDDGYKDITSVGMWLGVVEKYGFDPLQLDEQIELYVASKGGGNECDKGWCEYQTKRFSSHKINAQDTQRNRRH
jgi:acyl CoA:acetate/3-ketoacid CoA transferase alpha subunit